MAPSRPLVLASTSRYRAALLARLGVPFEQVASHVDERAHDGRWDSDGPVEYALGLARAKARAVAVRLDQPGTPARKVEQLMALSGRTHELVSGIVLLDAASGAERAHVDHQRLTLRAFTRAEGCT